MGLGAALNALTLGPEPLSPGAVAAQPPHARPVAVLLRRRLRRAHRPEAAADRAGDHRGGQRDGQHPRPRGHRDHRRRSRWSAASTSGSRSAMLLWLGELRGADPPLHAAHPPRSKDARRRPRGRDRPGRRHADQHRHRQALQPRHARGPGDAATRSTATAAPPSLRRGQRHLPLLADGARRHAAGAADRRRALLWTRARRRAGDIATGGAARHPHRADVGLGRR